MFTGSCRKAFYSIRSERQLTEQLEFNLLFRWFVGLGIDDRVWDATVFTKNRNGLVVDGLASRAMGSAECLAGEMMRMRREAAGRAVTVDADKAHDTADFVAACKAFGVEAHVARNTSGRRSNIADAMAESAPYRASQVHRKRIEEVFG